MATQSLYRRYRPRRFSELKGQDHIVRALRTSVAEGREGQAYLFSGPRGTGKTTTARIMAKVLNCEHPQDGEPCCECASCLSVERGTSYDVHELDAASNNGVDAMRDLIDKSALGTPGRHKVYILDEVHMLSKGAEAALLKTLEEPPPHVVFVLATTDPQKMSDTIRSRTQHLQFHLLGADTLQEHVRWVASDAGLSVSDEAIEQVLAQGAGSPRDTLSALELVSNSGGTATEVVALDDFVEAMIEGDPGRALKMIAHAVSRGRDPRTIAEELIGFLRNGFLSLMAPDLVQLPSQRLDALTDIAQRAGAARLVRGIEMLGEALGEMRNAPDPRVLLDVAAVRLSSVELTDDVAALSVRVERLERRLADGGSTPTTRGSSGAAAGPAITPAPEPSAAPATEPTSAAVDPATGRTKLGARAAVASTAGEVVDAGAVDPSPAAVAPPPSPTGAGEPVAEDAVGSQRAEPPDRVAEPVAAVAAVTEADWETVRPQLRGMARAVFSPATLVVVNGERVTLGLPNDAHRAKCEQHRPAVEQALSAHVGSSISVELVVAGGEAGPSSGGSGGSSGTPTRIVDASVPAATAGAGGVHRAGAIDGALAEDPAPPTMAADAEPAVDDGEPQRLHVVDGRAIADQARQQGPEPDPDAGLRTIADTLPDDDDVDLDGLVDAPPESVKSPVDRLAEAFPGSELVDDPY